MNTKPLLKLVDKNETRFDLDYLNFKRFFNINFEIGNVKAVEFVIKIQNKAKKLIKSGNYTDAHQILLYSRALLLEIQNGKFECKRNNSHVAA